LLSRALIVIGNNFVSVIIYYPEYLMNFIGYAIIFSFKWIHLNTVDRILHLTNREFINALNLFPPLMQNARMLILLSLFYCSLSAIKLTAININPWHSMCSKKIAYSDQNYLSSMLSENSSLA